MSLGLGRNGKKTPPIKQLDKNTSSSSLCEYLEPCDVHKVVNDASLTDLTVYHSNVCSLPKNLPKLFETFLGGTKLPDIIGVTETRLEEHLDAIDIDGYEFEPCFSKTRAGGVGIYIANYLSYGLRKDLSLNLDHCEDVWVEISTQTKTKHTKFQDEKKWLLALFTGTRVVSTKGFAKHCAIILILSINQIRTL